MEKPNKYRRGFEFRIVRGDGLATERGIEAFLRLSGPEYAEVLEDYLEIGKKRRNNRAALAKLQIHLLNELVVNEQMVSCYKKKAETLKTKPVGTSPEQQESTTEDLEGIERQTFFHRAHANCIR